MKRSTILALALYAVFLLGIAVWRPWATPAAPFSGRWELVPFTGTADLWRAGIVPFVFLFGGNVLGGRGDGRRGGEGEEREAELFRGGGGIGTGRGWHGSDE